MKKSVAAFLMVFMILSPALARADLTFEQAVDEIAQHLTSLNPITWVAPGEKYHLVIFIDNQCVYCSQIVKNIHHYTDAGFSVSFLTVAPPAIRDQVTEDMARVWCSATPQESLRNAMAGFLPANGATPECTDTIKSQSALAERIGIRATPVIVVMQKKPLLFVGMKTPSFMLKQLNEQPQ
ncbi:thioredoxin fold domain-containing protein [Pantoea sp. KPR_PJ]|uniref:thioredoxin fold domain-containing protein n=1 Tax=Pantoea sp. KPR_PJ TaxID=2738375 RepID=UPI0035289D7A